MKRILTAAAFAFGLAAGVTAASAANSTGTQTNNGAANVQQELTSGNQMNHTNLRQQLHNQLSQAGYSNIQIMPSSFYIQAKDKKGHPVAMVVGPDSFLEVTALANKSASASNPPNSGQTNSSQENASGSTQSQ